MNRNTKEKDREIIFGIVSPVGTDNKRVIDSLKQALSEVQYTPFEIHLSDYLKAVNPLPTTFDDTNQYTRINTLMRRGDEFRCTVGYGGVLADACIMQIGNIRKDKCGDKTKQIPRTAYILNSLKHPDEVETLRRTYGKSFWLISCYSPEKTRKDWLMERIKETNYDENVETLTTRLLSRDQEEGDVLGQNVRKTFPLADVFIDSKLGDLDKSMRRFVKLIFGYPFHGPTIDEYGMFLAQASAMMSLSLARQVGTSILTENGEVMTTGTNEVPNKNGGVCNTEKDMDKRECGKGFDSNMRQKNLILGDFLTKLKKKDWLVSEKKVKELLDDLIEDPELRKIKLMDLTEFSRETHAEMTALIEASRKSISVKNCFLYCTTFPCHICAKHIITAGIARVSYIEPYPKSMAETLFADFISVDKPNGGGLIEFNPFVGIASRRFMEIFRWGKEKPMTEIL